MTLFLRARALLPWLFMAGGCLLIGAVLAIPKGLILLLVLLALLAFVAFCVERPNAALSFSIVCVVLVPQYFALYLPGIPTLPIPLAPLAVLAGVLVLSALTARAPLPLPHPHSQIMGMFLLFGAALLASTFVADIKEANLALLRTYLIPLLLFFTTLYYARSGEQVTRVMNWLLAAACIAAVYAMLEFSLKSNYILEMFINSDIDSDLKNPMADWYHGGAAYTGDQNFLYRCFSFFTNPLEFGTFMTMLYPFALIRSVSLEGVMERRRYALAALVCALGVVLSFSRGPILAMILSTIGLTIFLPKLRRIVAMLAIGAVLFAVALWSVIGEQIQSRLDEVDNVTVRFKLWETGTRVFTDHPLFGVGLSQYAKYEDATIHAYGIGPFHEYGGRLDKISTVDNHLIQLAAETGILGLTTYLLLLTCLFYTLYHVWRRHPVSSTRHMALAIGASIFNYLFNGITITSYLLLVITMVFTFFLAATISLSSEVLQ